jgi:hypothetical protein
MVNRGRALRDALQFAVGIVEEVVALGIGKTDEQIKLRR